MTLLPPFEDFESTASWVSAANNNAGAAATKFEDLVGASTFDFAIPTNTNAVTDSYADSDFEALFGIKFPSPSGMEGFSFDQQLLQHQQVQHQHAGPSVPVTSALDKINAAGMQSLSNNVNRVAAPTALNPNTLQLDHLNRMSPDTPLSSGYPSPAFQFSPTPGLTMCNTNDSTPAPRSNSRCSSRSSFSIPTDGDMSVVSTAPGSPADGAASSRSKPKKEHLCTYEGCERVNRSFRSNADLQRHLRSHRGERPYACPAPGCQKAYGQQNKMVNHVKQNHPALLCIVDVGRRRGRRAGVPATAPATPAHSAPHSAASSAASTPASFGSNLLQLPSSLPIGRGHQRPIPYNRPNPHSVNVALAHAQAQQAAMRSPGSMGTRRTPQLGNGYAVNGAGHMW